MESCAAFSPGVSIHYPPAAHRQSPAESWHPADRRRFHPSAGSAVIATGERRLGGPYYSPLETAPAGVVQEADGLLRSGRFDPHAAQERVWDLTSRQFYGQRRHPMVFPHSLDRGSVLEAPPYPPFPSAANPHTPDWHGLSEFLRGQPKDFSLLDTPEIRGLFDGDRPQASGKATSEHSSYIHFDAQRDARSESHEPAGYLRAGARTANDSRWNDTACGAPANPHLHMWWGQYAPGGVSDDRGGPNYSQSEWPGAGRWRATQSGREDALQRSSYPSNPGKANLVRQYGGVRPAFSDLEEAMSASLAARNGRGHAAPEQDKLSSEEELSSSTQVEGNSGTKTRRPKTSKPKRPSQLQASKSAVAAKDAFFTCYVCLQKTDASHMKGYVRSRKICDACRNADFVMKNERKVKYCQLCSWIHPVGEFDAGRRSCKAELKRHNERRRNAKKQAAAAKAS